MKVILMNKKMSRKQNASTLSVKAKVNFKGNWQHTKNLTTRQQKRLEKKNV